VGGALLSHFGKQYNVLGSYRRHSKLGLTKLELTNREAVFEHLEKIQPKLVIHAAALTNVDYCEEHPQDAFAINVEGTRNIADAWQRMGGKFVFISTDYVFNGQNGPYSARDLPDPIKVYGQSKLEAEQVVRESCQDYLIVRCPLVFGKPSKIYQKLLRAKKEAVPVKVATDIFTNPINSAELAIILLELITTQQVGLVHIAGEGYMSRFEFASQLATSLGVEQKYIVGCDSSQLGYQAKRPARGGLTAGFRSLMKKFSPNRPQ
jgi:dTDP-4-dehydrorhamnose reductase